MSPPTAADLIFSPQANHNFSKTLGELKRSTLSIHNRLRSIQEDAAFAKTVTDIYDRPLIANERCGSWYIEPRWKAGSAYFKSTDGHTGVWKFNTRRLNLHLLEIIGRNNGCIIVDSTRRGKRMPDALSKTIPIWCSVLNRLLFQGKPASHELHTPPQVVSDSEHEQISALLPMFLESLQALELSIDTLRSQLTKPLRPLWTTPDSHLHGSADMPDDFHPIICCTVSRRVAGGEASEGGYIQGAADDTENWAHGLTPTIFWANKERLLSTPENELPDVIMDLVSSSLAIGADNRHSLRRIMPAKSLYVASLHEATAVSMTNSGITIFIHPQITSQIEWRTSPTRLDVGLGQHKIGSRNLRIALPFILEFTQTIVDSYPAKLPGPIIIACESGIDLSVGIALWLLCMFFDEDGKILAGDRHTRQFDKLFIRRRLGWIYTSMPYANPSRATLQSVNSFLMERLHMLSNCPAQESITSSDPENLDGSNDLDLSRTYNDIVISCLR